MAEGQRTKRREATRVRGTQSLQDPVGCIYSTFSGKVLRGFGGFFFGGEGKGTRENMCPDLHFNTLNLGAR